MICAWSKEITPACRAFPVASISRSPRAVATTAAARPGSQAAPGPQERRRGLVPGLGRTAGRIQGSGQPGQVSLGLADEASQIADLAHQRGRIQHGRVEAGQLGQRHIPR